MRRCSRVLLAAFLVLGVLLAGPSSSGATAAAKPLPTGWAQPTLTFGSASVFGVTFRSEFICSIPVRVLGNGDAVGGKNGFCRGGYDVTPGWTQYGEAGSKLELQVTGAGCAADKWSSAITGTNGPSDGVSFTEAVFPGVTWNVGTSCVPAGICMRITVPGGGAGYALECIQVVFPTVEDTTSACQYGTPLAGGWDLGPAIGGGTTGYWYGRGWVSINNPTALQQWRITPVFAQGVDYRDTTGAVASNYRVPGFGTNTGWNTNSAGAWTSGNPARWTATEDGNGAILTKRASTSVPHGPKPGIVGVQISHSMRPITSNWSEVGYTNPSQCQFYIGEKIKETPGTSAGDPWRSLDATDEPPAQEEPPAPAPEIPVDPDDDGDGWSPWEMIKSLFALLGQLFGTLFDLLRDVVSAITGLVSALLSGLVDLFVPDPGVISEQLESVTDAWSESTPGQWVGSLSDLAVTPPSGGCSGPTLSVPIADVDWSAKPLDACSGPGATMAGWSTMAITATVAVAGGFACIRILSSAFSWNPGFGGAEK